MRQELPEDWQKLATRAGIRPSFTGIAEASGLAISTVQRLVLEGRTSQASIMTLAETFHVAPEQIMKLSGVSDGDRVWLPTQEAQKLSPAVQAALDELIRTIVREGGSSASTGEPTKKTPGGSVIRGTFGDDTAPSRAELDRMAARHGQSEGKKKREQQNRDTEDGDGE